MPAPSAAISAVTDYGFLQVHHVVFEGYQRKKKMSGLTPEMMHPRLPFGREDFQPSSSTTGQFEGSTNAGPEQEGGDFITMQPPQGNANILRSFHPFSRSIVLVKAASTQVKGLRGTCTGSADR